MEKAGILGMVIGALIGAGSVSQGAEARDYCNSSGCQVSAWRPPGIISAGGGGFDSYDQSVSREDYRDPTENICEQIFSSAPPGCDLRNPPQVEVNGCGSRGSEAIPDYLISPVLPVVAVSFGGIFKPACDAHDMCYSNLGVSKDLCDEQLRIGMIDEAKRRMSPIQYATFAPFVEAQAVAYSRSLRWEWVQARFSGPAFDDAQRLSLCRNLAGGARGNLCI